MGFEAVQSFMRQQRIDAWLLYDFRGSNPVFGQLLPGDRFTTRRALLFIPAEGKPELLAHQIDASQYRHVPIETRQYLSWQDLHEWLAAHVKGRARLAMEYSPLNELPVVSVIDAGTIELVRSCGAGEIVSSADLIQFSVARWSAAALDQHRRASELVDQIKNDAFDRIRISLQRGAQINELGLQKYILKRFDDQGLEYPDSPIVAVNTHSGDPHFEVSDTSPAPIRRGDWVLIDLWARVPGDANIFSDITWVACAGEPSAKQREVFDVVKAARDACVERATRAWQMKEEIEGWQLDDAARNIIIERGYGKFIRHRTGHSLSPGQKVHGLGVNIDNLETHDTRRILPGIGYTVEPGIYLPEFGVRLEINVFVDPDAGPTITSDVQNQIIICA
jgi:Xaa-Pro aminopeptidase